MRLLDTLSGYAVRLHQIDRKPPLLIGELAIAHDHASPDTKVSLAITTPVRHRLVLGSLLNVAPVAARADDAVRPAGGDKATLGSSVVWHLPKELKQAHVVGCSFLAHTPSKARAAIACQGEAANCVSLLCGG